MQKSMTGFGKSEVRVANKKITVEVRSLNSKQLDLAVKMPQIYRAIEFDIRSIVAQALVRGKVEVTVSVEADAVCTDAAVNKDLFRAYLQQTIEAVSYANADVAIDAIIPAVLRMPGVVATESATTTDEELVAVKRAVSEAVAKLDEFRKQEGETLIADLLSRVGKIEHLREEITPFEEARADAVRTKIRESIANMNIEVDNNRLEQEMIFYIEKLDITEEKVRLANHCKYFREVAASEEAAGRKLGFIAQEMGREINTTGSKANNHDIQIIVVRMKDELEKIKEQVLNLL